MEIFLPNDVFWCNTDTLKQCVDIDRSDALIESYIFSDRFANCVCVDGAFDAHIFPYFENFLLKCDETAFYMAVLSKGELVQCMNCDINKNIHSQEYCLPHIEFMGTTTRNDAFEFVYFSPSCEWVGWIHMLWEIGIFAFANKSVADCFVDEMQRRDLYTPKEVVESIWHNPKRGIAKKFLELYEPMAYPLGEYIDNKDES